MTTPALAQSWKDKYPELVLALVPAENATGTLDRYTPFVNYLTKELGVKVTMRVASDYTAVIEGQKNKQIHIGFYGRDRTRAPTPFPAGMSFRSSQRRTATARSATIR